MLYAHIKNEIDGQTEEGEEVSQVLSRVLRQLALAGKQLERVGSRMTFARRMLNGEVADFHEDREIPMLMEDAVARTSKQLEWTEEDVIGVADLLAEVGEAVRAAQIMVALVERQRDSARMVAERLGGEVAGWRSVHQSREGVK